MTNLSNPPHGERHTPQWLARLAIAALMVGILAGAAALLQLFFGDNWFGRGGTAAAPTVSGAPSSPSHTPSYSSSSPAASTPASAQPTPGNATSTPTSAAPRSETSRTPADVWFYLTNQERLSGTNADTEADITVDIDGKSYLRSITFFISNGYVEYNLRKGCKTLRATIGWDDTVSTPEDAVAYLEFTQEDGRPLHKKYELRPGQPRNIVLDVSGVLRLVIRNTSKDAGVAIGSPQVSCPPGTLNTER